MVLGSLIYSGHSWGALLISLLQNAGIWKLAEATQFCFSMRLGPCCWWELYHLHVVSHPLGLVMCWWQDSKKARKRLRSATAWTPHVLPVRVKMEGDRELSPPLNGMIINVMWHKKYIWTKKKTIFLLSSSVCKTAINFYSPNSFNSKHCKMQISKSQRSSSLPFFPQIQ